MQDEGLHEIQLNGKQLVFLFMAATVVSVVIFLCGVMVGRGVPTPRGAVLAEANPNADPTAVAQSSTPAPITDFDNGPVAANETLTYTDILEGSGSSIDTLKPPSEPSAPAAAARVPAPPTAEPAVARVPAPPPAPPPVAVAPKPAPKGTPKSALVPAPAPKQAVAPAPKATAAVATTAKATVTATAAPVVAATTGSEPAGGGFVVQVAAVRTRPDADAMARRLSAKGYPAFVTTSGANFRVRVGRYDDRRQAETIAGRLEREEQFKPWITK